MLPGEIVAHTALFDCEIRMVREVHAVMRAMKLAPVDLPRYPTKALFTAASLPAPMARLILGRSIAGGRGTKPPSLLLDVRAGKSQTEVKVLNGAVAAAARAAGISAPVNATYAAILEEISNNPNAWSRYRNQPQALIAAVEGASHEHA
jgi:ketopantoate reductase